MKKGCTWHPFSLLHSLISSPSLWVGGSLVPLECNLQSGCHAFELRSEVWLQYVAGGVFEVHAEAVVSDVAHQSVGHFVAMQSVGFDFLFFAVEGVAGLERCVGVEIQLRTAREIPVAAKCKVELERHNETERMDAAELGVRTVWIGCNGDLAVVVQEELIVAGHAIVAPRKAEAEAEERGAAHARGEDHEVAHFQLERLAHVDVDTWCFVDTRDESEVERCAVRIGCTVAVFQNISGRIL